MGTNENLRKAVRGEFKTDSLTNVTGTSFSNNFGSRLKRIVLITSLAGTALLFKGSASGYVASEPAYV
jgi:hypothetical protein